MQGALRINPHIMKPAGKKNFTMGAINSKLMYAKANEEKQRQIKEYQMMAPERGLDTEELNHVEESIP